MGVPLHESDAITQISIDKLREFPGNVLIYTKYINVNNAQTVLTKISLSHI